MRFGKWRRGPEFYCACPKTPAIQERYFPTNRKLLLHAKFIKGMEMGGAK
jgi:hypothetical protein